MFGLKNKTKQENPKLLKKPGFYKAWSPARQGAVYLSLSQLENDLICLTTTTQLAVLLCDMRVNKGPEHELLSLTVHLHNLATAVP